MGESEQRHQWSFLGLGDSETFTVDSMNADLLRKIFEQLGAGRLFEIKRPR